MIKMRKFFDRMIQWSERLGVVFLVIMVVLVFANAVSRYLFHFGLNQVEELARFAFIWLSFLGGAVAYHRKEHITIPLLIGHLKGITYKIVTMVARTIISGTYLYFLYSAWNYTMNTLTVKAPGTGIYFGFISSATIVMALLCLVDDAMNLAETLITHTSEEGRG